MAKLMAVGDAGGQHQAGRAAEGAVGDGGEGGVAVALGVGAPQRLDGAHEAGEEGEDGHADAALGGARAGWAAAGSAATHRASPRGRRAQSPRRARGGWRGRGWTRCRGGPATAGAARSVFCVPASTLLLRALQRTSTHFMTLDDGLGAAAILRIVGGGGGGEGLEAYRRAERQDEGRARVRIGGAGSACSGAAHGWKDARRLLLAGVVVVCGGGDVVVEVRRRRRTQKRNRRSSSGPETAYPGTWGSGFPAAAGVLGR